MFAVSCCGRYNDIEPNVLSCGALVLIPDESIKSPIRTLPFTILPNAVAAPDNEPASNILPIASIESSAASARLFIYQV